MARHMLQGTLENSCILMQLKLFSSESLNVYMHIISETVGRLWRVTLWSWILKEAHMQYFKTQFIVHYFSKHFCKLETMHQSKIIKKNLRFGLRYQSIYPDVQKLEVSSFWKFWWGWTCQMFEVYYFLFELTVIKICLIVLIVFPLII